MRSEVVVYFLRGKARSQRIARVLQSGAKNAGYRSSIKCDGDYECPHGDVAAFYGYQKNMPKIMADYIACGKKVVFVDLGYWHRQLGGRWMGFHKIAVNARHPDAYLMSNKQPQTRFNRFNIKILPWQQRGKAIIVAGMSAKSAESYALKPEEWERWAVAELQKHTKRQIIYRPKPSWKEARPIKGAAFQHIVRPIGQALLDCHAVVTHHSNVAVDAVLAGVPAFCWRGGAESMSLQDLSLIERPYYPKHRGQWASNLAFCQWDVKEMMNGNMFRHLKEEGLIP